MRIHLTWYKLMFIVLTNKSEGFEGADVAIRKSLIRAVFDKPATNGIDTYVYIDDNLTYKVKESVNNIASRLSDDR